MRRTVASLALALTFVLGCATAQIVAQTAQAGPSAAGWEYLEIRPPVTHSKRQELLSKLGSEGWELVLFTGDFLVFKRPA